MEARILEGTLIEIQRQISELPYAPETRLRVTVEPAELQVATKCTHKGASRAPVTKSEAETAGTPPGTVEPFQPTEFRNGVPLLPRRTITEPITTEWVKRLLDEEDEELLRVYRTPGR